MNMEETHTKVSERWKEFIKNSEREKEQAQKEIRDILADFGKEDAIVISAFGGLAVTVIFVLIGIGIYKAIMNC